MGAAEAALDEMVANVRRVIMVEYFIGSSTITDKY
jgi:hypothetical protein